MVLKVYSHLVAVFWETTHKHYSEWTQEKKTKEQLLRKKVSLKGFMEKELISRFGKGFHILSFHLIRYMYQDVEMGEWNSWTDSSTYLT